MLAVLLTLARAFAGPIAVNNHSFESANYAGANSWTNDITDANAGTSIEWQGRDGNNDGNCFIERIGGFFSDGAAHIGMDVGYYIYQDTGVAWTANTRYTLTVGCGRRNDGFSTADNKTVIGLTNVAPDLATYPTMAALLAGDPQFAASSSSVGIRTVAANSQFVDRTVIFDTGAVPPGGTVIVVVGDNSVTGRSHFDNIRLSTVSTLDPDADGLPSDWETANGLDPNSAAAPNGAGHDFDSDGSTNADEFARGTKPNDNDTDDDSALDGAENNTGTYVSSTNTGTNPLKPDTDGDTILDGLEAGAAQPTNPNLADTDGDQFEDQAEIAAGTNPSAGGQGSFPVFSGDLFIGMNFIGGRVDGTLGASVTNALGDAGLIPQGNWNNLADLSGAGAPLVNSTGGSVIMRANWTVDDTYTVEVGAVPADANGALMQGFLRTRNGVPTTVTVRNIAVPTYDVYIYCDGEALDRVSTYTANGQTLTGIRDDTNYPVTAGGGTFVLASTNGSSGNVVLFRNVTGPTLTITAANTGPDFGAAINAIQIVRSTGDADGDGMPDAWEIANSLNKNVNDAASDADSDGSTNLQEFTRNTNPQDSDSDDDTLLDGVETGTGNYQSAANTGTNPLKADTDGDGFGDALENDSGNFVDAADPGTDPNLADTDADGFPDAEEVGLGTNPVLAASIPPYPSPIGYWPFNDQAATTADLTPGNHPGTVNGAYVYVAGCSGLPGDYAIRFNGVDVSVTTGAPLLDGLATYTMAGWVNFDADQAGRTGLWGQNDLLEFGMVDLDTLGGWDPVGGQLETAFGPDSGGWKHVAITDDGTNKRLYLGGVLVATGAKGTPLGSNGGSFNIGGGGIWDAANNWFNGTIDDVAVWDRALGPTFLSQLAAKTRVPYAVPGAIPVTALTFNKTTGQFSFTFESIPGRTYSIFRSPSLTPANDWFEITDSLSATGTATTFSETVNPGTQPRMYYRAQLNP